MNEKVAKKLNIRTVKNKWKIVWKRKMDTLMKVKDILNEFQKDMKIVKRTKLI